MSCTTMDVWIDVLLIGTFASTGLLVVAVLVLVIKSLLGRT
jgi:hypothetical protein